jgi:hypothetical protein
MYNKEILAELVRQFGEENTIIFCQMESVKNSLLMNSNIENEFDFERDWWKENGEKLQGTRLARCYQKLKENE